MNKSYRQRPGLLWGRRLTIFRTSVGFAIPLLWDWLTGSIQKNQPPRAVQLRQILTQLGPTFIKLGQILSCRPDIIPPIYIEELTNLQDQLPSFPNAIAYELIAEELGQTPDRIYAEISAEPVAAASFGQVYKGKLKTGETVAIKVQRPGLRSSISLDLYILRQIAAWAQKSISFIHSDLMALIDELASRLFEELDYINEGRNAERFGKLYANNNNIIVPRIYWEYTGQRVLTMEWIAGVKLTEIEQLNSGRFDGVHFVNLGYNCSVRQLLESGFFHADPHPGNLLATPEGKLAYIDFGMMSFVTAEYRYSFIESIMHILTGDFEGLAQDYVKLGFLPPETDLNFLVPELADIFGKVLTASVTEFGINSVIKKLSPLIYKHPFRLPTYYLLIFRSLATLEGVAIAVNPELKPFGQIYPYVAQRLLTDKKLTSCLQELLWENGKIRWELLEVLLSQMRDSPEWNMRTVLTGSLEFLYSNQGTPVRRALVDEIVTGTESLLVNGFEEVTAKIGLVLASNPGNWQYLNQEMLQKLQSQILELTNLDRQEALAIIEIFFKPQMQTLVGELIEKVGQRLRDRVKLNIAGLLEPRNSTSQKVGWAPPTSTRRSGTIVQEFIG
ncbi:MAG: ABC1 kinase family protein [Hormoscilla sp.]